jgi:Domain of unknown function (DUF222)
MFEKWVAGSAGPGGAAHLEGTVAAAGGEATARLDSAELIDRLVGLRAAAARLDGEMLGLMAEFVTQRRVEDAGPGASMSEAFAVDELALAIVSTRHRVRQQLGLAQALGGELSATGKMLSAGVIDSYQAWVIYDMLSWLVEPEHVTQVEADILDRAPYLTGGQLRSRLARLITATEPDAFAARHQQAMADRRLSANTGSAGDQLDGMGSLWLSHAAVDIAAIDNHITRLARAHIRDRDGEHAGADQHDRNGDGGSQHHHDRDGDGNGNGCGEHGVDGRRGPDARSFDNVRADVARDLLLGRHQLPDVPGVSDLTGAPAAPDATGGPSGTDQPDANDQTEHTHHPAGTGESEPSEPAPNRSPDRGAQVVVVVPIQSLMGIDETPGQLLGYGPIPAAVARAVASCPDSVWRRLLTDPAGNLADLSTAAYRPGKVLDLAVTVRDGTSRFPRSNASAVGADFDHTIPYPSGETSYGNGGKLSRRDHRVKHAPGWRVTQGPEPGQFTWTTPTGHTYPVRPVDQPAGNWPKPWQLDPDPPDPAELLTQLAGVPDYLDDHLLHELAIDPPDQ